MNTFIVLGYLCMCSWKWSWWPLIFGNFYPFFYFVHFTNFFEIFAFFPPGPCFFFSFFLFISSAWLAGPKLLHQRVCLSSRNETVYEKNVLSIISLNPYRTERCCAACRRWKFAQRQSLSLFLKRKTERLLWSSSLWSVKNQGAGKDRCRVALENLLHCSNLERRWRPNVCPFLFLAEGRIRMIEGACRVSWKIEEE